MKQFILSVFFIASSSLSLSSQVVYVDADATGANNGSSWVDAYTSLDAALGDSLAAEIWVAGGLYIPGGNEADTSSSFTLQSAIDLYGGFSGNEADRSERNPAQNETILSGDIMQNDNGTMDPALRMDNARHVIFVNDGIDTRITISGFTISGGQTSDNLDHEFTNRAGGGIYSESALQIDNCIFTNNFGRSGGAVCINNSGNIVEEIRITNSTFEENSSTSQSAGIVLFAVSDVLIESCSFTDNTTNRGVVYPQDCQNVRIIDCSFENNDNPTGFGGAIFSWQNLNLQLEGCQFRSNSSVQAACMYYDARETVSFNPSLTIRNCNFQNNIATDGFSGAFTLWQGMNILIEDCEFNRNTANSAGAILYNGSMTPGTNPENFVLKNCEFGTNEAVNFGGGACYFSSASFTIDSCTFLGNIGANSGGALFCTGSDKNYMVSNCFFGLNNATYGGAMTNYGDNTNGIIRNCEFLTNSAGTGGGAMNCGFKANILLDKCRFTGGVANVGGAVSAQNDSTTITVRECSFIQNTANNSGGGFFTFTGDLSINMENSVFENNNANFGGAVHLSGSNNIDTSFFTVDKCTFSNNEAVTQGGAINVINKSGMIRNTLIHGNIAQNIGTGGAISTNASGDTDIEITLMNATLSNNLGLLSSGIAAWTDSVATNKLRLQNTILDNGNDYEVEDGNPELISLGGNFSSDQFLDILLGINDIIGTDPLFVDPGAGDFHLMEGSPCIDAGVNENAPEDDLDGMPRDEMPDIGAYEYQPMSSVLNNTQIEDAVIWPNPARDILRISLPENLNSGYLNIYNALGNHVYSTELNNNMTEINLDNMPAGKYYLFIQAGKLLKAEFIKL